MKIDYTYWTEEDGTVLGYLNDYPDHWTQGKDLDDLKEFLLDLHREFSVDTIPGIRKVGQLEVAWSGLISLSNWSAQVVNCLGMEPSTISTTMQNLEFHNRYPGIVKSTKDWQRRFFVTWLANDNSEIGENWSVKWCFPKSTSNFSLQSSLFTLLPFSDIWHFSAIMF